MSLFSAFGQKGLAALASTLENIGNIVAPIAEDEEDPQNPTRHQREHVEEQDDEEDTFESRIQNFINARKVELETPSMEPLQSPNGSLIEIDLNDSGDSSDISLADHSYSLNYNKLKDVQLSPTTSSSSSVFLSNNELEKRVQMKYRESLESEIASFNAKLREAEVKSQQHISRIQHDCDHWKSVAEAQRMEIANLKASLRDTPKTMDISNEIVLKYEECKATNEQLTRSMTQTTIEFNELSEQYDTLSKEQEQSKASIHILTQQLNHSNEKLNHLQKEYTTLQTQNNELKQQSLSNNNETDDKVNKLTEALQQKSNEISKLLQDLEENQSSLQSSNERNAQLSEELMSTCDEVESLNKSLETCQIHNNNLQKELNLKIEELNKQTQHWNDLLTSSENALKEAETVAWTCKAEASELLFALKLAEEKVVQYEKEMESLKVQNVLLTNTVAELKSRTAEVTDSLTAKEHDIASEVENLKHSKAQLEVSVQSKMKEIDEQSSKILGLEAQLVEAKHKITNLEELIKKNENMNTEKNQQYEVEVEKLRNEVVSLNQSLQHSAESEKKSVKDVEDLKNNLQQIQEALAKKADELLNKENEIVKLTSQLSSTQAHLNEDEEKRNKNLEASHQKQSELNEEIINLKILLTDKENELNELKSINHNLRNEIQVLSQNQSQLAHIESELQVAKKEIKVLTATVSDYKIEKHKLEEQLQHHDHESKNILTALKKEVDKCQELQSQNTSLKEKLTIAQSNQSSDNEKLTQTLESYQKKIHELENVLHQMSTSATEQVNIVTTLQNEKHQLQVDLNTHIEEMNKLSINNAGLKSQLNSIKEEILTLTVNLENSKVAQHNAEVQKEHLEAESRNVLTALKKEVEKCQELQKEIASLKQGNHSISSDTTSNISTDGQSVVIDLQNQLNSLTHEYNIVNEKLNEMTSKYNKLEADSAAATTNVNDAKIQEEFSRQAEQLKVLEMSLKTAMDAKAAAEAEVQAINARYADIGNHFGSAKQQLQKFETENRQLHQVIAQLRQVRKANKGEEENLLVERDELRMQNTNLLAEVSRLEKLANASTSNAEQVIKFRSELNASLNKALYLEQALDDTKRQFSILEKEHYNKVSQLDIVSSDLMLVKQDLDLSQLEVRNLKDAMNIIQSEQQNESQRLHHDFEEKTKQIRNQFEEKQKQIIEEYTKKYEDCLQRCQEAEQKSQDEQLFRRRAELDFNNEKKKVQKTLESALSQLNNTQQDVVDRMLISNLIVSYFKRRRSMEVMEIIAKVLSFNEEQKVVVGLKVAPVNLISSIFATVIGSSTPNSAGSEIEGENLAEQWINFLITEAENKPTNNSSSNSKPSS